MVHTVAGAHLSAHPEHSVAADIGLAPTRKVGANLHTCTCKGMFLADFLVFLGYEEFSL